MFPALTRYDASVRPAGLILMLHGGKDRSGDAVDGRSLSWRRSAWMQREIARRAQEADTSVWLLTFRERGWNGGADKATLYRRWNGKASLVVDALLSVKAAPEVPDTGHLREDLILSFCGHGGLTDHQSVATFASVITAISRDEEFAAAFRERVVGPKAAVARAIFERARDRGQLREGIDLDLLAPALAGIVLHRMFLLGLQPDEETVTRVIDQIILPAALPPTASGDR